MTDKKTDKLTGKNQENRKESAHKKAGSRTDKNAVLSNM